MSALAFAWRSLVRQPARSGLGILGVAAVGALLLDMLMLSDGLVVSMRDLLDRAGFDVRVTAGGDLPRGGIRIARASASADALLRVPGVRGALAVRLADGTLDRLSEPPLAVGVQAVHGSPPMPWTLVRGADLGAEGEVIVNMSLAEAARLSPGGEVTLRASCAGSGAVLPPVRLRVAGVADFPFQGLDEHLVAMRMATLDAACGATSEDQADMLLVTSTGDSDEAAREIERARPDLRALTNQEVVGRLERTGFTYFRQISLVLTTVTLSFAVLLITVLLTVSVNQRLGEIAALRALGLSRRRVVADVFCESSLIVGIGGALSIPTGALLAAGLDRILKAMPGIPLDIHFFVFQRQTLLVHVVLLALTALGAALYPMRVVAVLPIAATLRREVAS